MMIAARLAGGNLFLPFLWWGIFLVGDFGSTRSSSEHSDFLRGGDFWGLFLIGSVGFSGLGHLFSDAALL